jgi:hypothetical protein
MESCITRAVGVRPPRRATAALIRLISSFAHFDFDASTMSAGSFMLADPAVVERSGREAGDGAEAIRAARKHRRRLRSRSRR